MKRRSNDDILNCDVPINRPGKVPLISVAVRDDWFLEKVTHSHNVIIGCAFYIAWDWFPRHRLNLKLQYIVLSAVKTSQCSM